MERPRLDCYQCKDNECDVSEERLSSCNNALYCWKSTTLIRVNGSRERNSRGCIYNERHSRFFCKNSVERINVRTECCAKTFCNGGIFPTFMPANNDSGAPTETTETVDSYMLLTIFGPMIFVMAVACTIGFYCRKHIDISWGVQDEQHEMMRLRSLSRDSSTIDTHEDQETNLSQKISLIDRWASGSFGQNPPELWCGKYRARKVMIKIYSLNCKRTWAYETEIYKNLMLAKHHSVLEHIVSEMTTGIDDRKQFWLVTRSHRNGPLASYLRNAKFDQKTMLKTCSSLTCGLTYLHQELAIKGKLAMAHRNLCSNNVFVKRDGSCVIGGFECSTASNEDWVSRDSLFIELADKRYLSPEYVSLPVEDQVWTLDRFQHADLYSLGLLFWEICRMCCESKNVITMYATPYYEWLDPNTESEPTLEKMYDTIVVNRRRPKLLDHWGETRIMHDMGNVMRACWRPGARMSLVDIKREISILTKII